VVNFGLPEPVQAQEGGSMKHARGIPMLIALMALAGACMAGSPDGLKAVKKAENYQIMMGIKPDKKVPTTGKLLIEIQPTGKWKFNEKAPVVVNLDVPEGVQIENKKLRKKDVAVMQAKKCRFEVPFRLPKKGSFDLKLAFDFVICTDTLCQKKRFTLPYPLSTR
jgi:hypothetical protein